MFILYLVTDLICVFLAEGKLPWDGVKSTPAGLPPVVKGLSRAPSWNGPLFGVTKPGLHRRVGDCENCGATARRLGGGGGPGGGEAARGTLKGLALLPVGWSGHGLADRGDLAHLPARGAKFPGRSGVQARSPAAVGKNIK